LLSGSAGPFKKIGAEEGATRKIAMGVDTARVGGLGIDLIKTSRKKGRCSSAWCFESLSHYEIPLSVAMFGEAILEVP
jgi:hypothetical protein